MLQRESEDILELDPRLEKRSGPDGSNYFYGPRSTSFLRSPVYYETSRGGILAETMGLGKTLMCIALIVSTKGYLPKVPIEYETVRKRPKVGSLVQMAASSIHRHSAPWTSFFEKIAASKGEYLTECVDAMQRCTPFYTIATEQVRWDRSTTPSPSTPKRLVLASTTLVVVPRNLFSQWKSELEKHLTAGTLSVLFMEDTKKALPSPQDLRTFDVVLFSRPRFEQEHRNGSDSNGRRKSRYPVSCSCPYIGATRIRDCTCVQEMDLYSSPLQHLHFLRMIIDEGHFFSSSKTHAAQVANQIVRADHRWVITGTPAGDLLGVEMSISSDVSGLPDGAQRQRALEHRKNFSSKEDTTGAIKSIGDLVTHFLKVPPWTASKGERPAEWKNDIYRQEYPASKLHVVGFCGSLRRVLENIVVKTRPEDVERDIELPPLEHCTVRLEPSYYDKLTANTFALVLTANAVTSERTDTDYLFHSKSGADRNKLVANLRRSAFAWTAFSEEDVKATIENSEGYLAKEGTMCSEEDRTLLNRCVAQAKHMLTSSNWLSLTRSHEVGLLVENWPATSARFWSFDLSPSIDSTKPFICGVTQLLKAQNYVNERADLLDPSEGLAGVGIRELRPLRQGGNESVLVKSGIPSSSMNGQSAHHHVLGAEKIKAEVSVAKALLSDSVLRTTQISGTTSAKLTYLLSRVSGLHREEKILIFYDSDDAAYYIAQSLDLVHIHYYIYAKSLSSARKSEYIVQFNNNPKYRVLLMDVGQAAFGLNVSSASRIFFLNPVCQPHIEAQAIKRAHRIGQKRKVIVETLVLKDTIEEQMFERAKRMTRMEHSDAKTLDDDKGIKEIIQNVKLLPISEEESKVTLMMSPEQLWSRPDWPTWKSMHDETSSPKKGKKRTREDPNNRNNLLKKRRAVSSISLVDVTDPLEPGRIVDAEELETSLQFHRSTKSLESPAQFRPSSIFGG